MLAYLVNLYFFGSCFIYGWYIRHDMSDFQYYIQQQYDQNFWHLCHHNWVSTSSDKCSLVQEEYPTFYVSSSWFQQHFNWNLQARNIDSVYVIRRCIYHPSVELSKCGNNIQHSMLTFYKKTHNFSK